MQQTTLTRIASIAGFRIFLEEENIKQKKRTVSAKILKI